MALSKDHDALAKRLKINGATEAEIKFLMSGRRVELNAMPSDMFVSFVEGALRSHGVEKVIPGAALLARAYAAMKRSDHAAAALADHLRRLNAEPIEPPADLADQVRRQLAENPTATWDEAIRSIVGAVKKEREP